MSDPVRTLLDRLDGDVARVAAVDVAAVRHRGDQRRRRQGALAAAGSALAVVAVVLVGFGLNGTSSAHQPPATSSAPSLPSPTSSPTDDRPFAFFTPAGLPGPATGASWETIDATPSSAVTMCVDPAATDARSQAERWFATGSAPRPGDEIAVERLLTFESAARASIAFTALTTQAMTCSYDISQSGLTPSVGDQVAAWYYRVEDGADNAASMQSLVIVRVGARLAVLTVAMDGNGDIPYIDDLQQRVPAQLAEKLNASAR